ncbi:MAG: ABC transporter permease [Candidatus Hermodarchaeota archaeon]
MEIPSVLLKVLGILETEILTNQRKIILGLTTLAFLSVISPFITFFLPIIAEIYNLSALLPSLEIRPTPGGAVKGAFEELELWGSIILAILIAGTIAGEREKETFLFLASRPVASKDIVLGKAGAWLIVSLLATIIVFIISTGITFLMWGTAPIFEALLAIPTFVMFFLLLISFAIAMSCLFHSQVASTITTLISWISTIYVIERVPLLQVFTPFYYSEQALNVIEGITTPTLPLALTYIPLALASLICLVVSIYLIERGR